MKWLRELALRWLGFHTPTALSADNGNVNPLPMMSHWENPKSLTVVQVRNGFLICHRIYNPNGPDSVDAIFAPDASSLGPMLIAELSALRLKK